MSNKRTTTVVLRIQWSEDLHIDPSEWDWVELIDPDDEDEAGTPTMVVPHDAYVEYARYVGENLERIASDGWVPVCFEEFLESEEYAGNK